MTMLTRTGFALMLFMASAAAGDQFNCHVTGPNPGKEYPNCANTAQCSGEAYRWSNRSNCEITCMQSTSVPDEFVDVGWATCMITGDNGEPDCGGWPCI
jgi:hypothetical protein